MNRTSGDLNQFLIFLAILLGCGAILVSVSPSAVLILGMIIFLCLVGWIMARNFSIEETKQRISEAKEAKLNPEEPTLVKPEVMDVPPRTPREERKQVRDGIRYGWLPVLLLLTAVPMFIVIYIISAR